MCYDHPRVPWQSGMYETLPRYKMCLVPCTYLRLSFKASYLLGRDAHALSFVHSSKV